MYNIHLNGDIIRCPDIAANKQQLQRTRDKLGICEFGVIEDDCKTWQVHVWKNVQMRLNTRCTLCKQFKEYKNFIGSLSMKKYLCPKAQERYNNSTKEKQYKIDNQTYRKLSSAGHYLVKTSKHKTLFLTLTFPKWKKGFNPKENENKLNECFSKFVENLRKNYNSDGYIAVRENGEKNHRYHFHIAISLPFYPFWRINNAWNSAISDICESSSNSVSSRKGKVVLKNPASAVRYICKYISKSKGQASKTRIVFCSNNLFRQPVAVRNYENVLYNKTGFMHMENLLLTYKSLKITKLNDYCTAFRVDNYQEFDKFCKEALYPLFYLGQEFDSYLYSYPSKKPPGS